MGALDYVSNPADLPRGTLTELFLEAADRFADEPAFAWFEEGGLREMRFRDAVEIVRAAAGALAELGLQRGDRAAILSENRPEWALADYACLSAGVLDVPVYPSLITEQVRYILENAEVRLVFASSAEQVEKVRTAAGEAGLDLRIVVFDSDVETREGELSWDDFLERGRGRDADPDAFREEALRAEPDDVATILYTSGTTGDPKGVMLTHDNLFSNVKASARALPVTEADTTLSFLPLSHVFQRMVDYLLLTSGCTIAYARSIQTVADDMKVVRPTVVVSVPRLYEKVYARVMEAEGVRGMLVEWAREVGDAWADAKLSGREPSGVLKLVHRIADRLVFRKIRQGVGGRVRYFVSGGGALSPDLARFFYSAGLPILEGYGLTETSPVTNVNTEEHYRIGTVGRPVAGTEIRIAEDGEILVRGRQVMKGYYRNPEATHRAMTEDGWFHTGDVGEIDADGFLKITDRKKDILVTSGGKNVAPQPIENRLVKNRFVEQAVMVGDGRKFVALLVVPAFERLEAWARSEGIPFSDRESLLRDDEVQEKMRREVFGELGDLSRYETPKKLGLIPEEFTIEGGALTPTQKIKRRVVEGRYRELIDGFYREEAVDQTVFVGGRSAVTS